MVRIKDIIHLLEEWAPPAFAESYDNVGLLVGHADREVRAVLVSLDCTEDVIDEAVSLGANLIVSHHPIIFKGLKRISGGHYVERVVEKAIINGIALYAIHTNLDHVQSGVNGKIAEKLGLTNVKILQPKAQLLEQLSVHVPKESAAQLRAALFTAGAGQIGNYSDCSFEVSGTGSFLPKPGAVPAIGIVGEPELVSEVQINVIYEGYKRQAVLSAMRAAHPYQEVAHYCIPLSNTLHEVGSGMVGTMSEPLDSTAFLEYIKQNLNLKVIRHTHLLPRKIEKVALCGGSGSFLLGDAMRQKADAYITADMKYHEYFEADRQILVADIGHYESERFTIDLIAGKLTEKFTTFATHLTAVNTNPIDYI